MTVRDFCLIFKLYGFFISVIVSQIVAKIYTANLLQWFDDVLSIFIFVALLETL